MKMIGRMFLVRSTIQSMNKSVNMRKNIAFFACKRGCQTREFSSIKDEKGKARSEEEVNDKPIPYSTSAAAGWSSRWTFGELPKDKQPPALQSPAILISLLVFLIYFCVLREENDVDEMLSIPLYEKVEGLEEVNLMQAIKYRTERGLDTKELQARLQELKSLK